MLAFRLTRFFDWQMTLAKTGMLLHQRRFYELSQRLAYGSVVWDEWVKSLPRDRFARLHSPLFAEKIEDEKIIVEGRVTETYENLSGIFADSEIREISPYLPKIDFNALDLDLDEQRRLCQEMQLEEIQRQVGDIVKATAATAAVVVELKEALTAIGYKSEKLDLTSVEKLLEGLSYKFNETIIQSTACQNNTATLKESAHRLSSSLSWLFWLNVIVLLLILYKLF